MTSRILRGTGHHRSIVWGVGFLLLCSLGVGQPRFVPMGITEPRSFYRPNDSANPVTGEKTGWAVAGSTKSPRYGMWQNQEHAILKTAADRWLVVAMETNRNYLTSPLQEFVDAYTFLEYDNGILWDATTPTVQIGYWRGNALDSHPYVWAPYVFPFNGSYYLFYTASDPDHPGWLGCFLATSTTGSANPAEWSQYDPNPSTTPIEALFSGVDAGIKDFHVIQVDTPQGPRFYCYYIANPAVSNPLAPSETIGVAQVRLRISNDLLSWNDKDEIVVFDKINIGETHPSRFFVDYENPEILQYDDGSFYLFISRHGQLPADFGVNPNWEPIPLATEVYWSSDGLQFRGEDRLPDLESPNGHRLNAAELVHDGDRWYATHAQPSNNIDHYEFDEPYNDPVAHSELFQILVASFQEPENSVQILEIEWTPLTAAVSWMLYLE